MTEPAASQATLGSRASSGSKGFAALTERAGSWLYRQFWEPERPRVALEVRPGSLGIVRVKKEAGRLVFAGGASVELPSGVLELSITQPNIADPKAFEDSLRALLTRAGVGGSTRIGLVLPDPVARVALVPAAEVEARGKAALDEVMRFKLRKSVPFEIKESRIAVATARHAESVVAVVIFQPVLEGYERACLAVGLQPGLVELSGFALLRAAVPAAEAAGAAGADRLLVNWDEGYVTLWLARGDWPLLVRTLTGEAASAPREVIREVANTVLYYRERLAGKGLAQALLRSAALPGERAATLLSEALGMTPQILEPLGAVAGVGLGATTQALAGAAACLSGGIS